MIDEQGRRVRALNTTRAEQFYLEEVAGVSGMEIGFRRIRRGPVWSADFETRAENDELQAIHEDLRHPFEAIHIEGLNAIAARLQKNLTAWVREALIAHAPASRVEMERGLTYRCHAWLRERGFTDRYGVYAEVNYIGTVLESPGIPRFRLSITSSRLDRIALDGRLGDLRWAGPE